VLRTRPLGEADRIVILFSKDRGKIDAVARGARRPGSAFGGRLEFFTRVEIMLHAGRSLDTITSARIVKGIWEQLVDPDRFAAASYVAEVVDALCEPGMAVPELYDALCGFQSALAASTDFEALLAVMNLRILNALGVSPELDACARCGGVLGQRPLVGGRAWLSPQAGGLLCTACVRSLREGAEQLRSDLLSVSAADLAGLRTLRELPLELWSEPGADGKNVAVAERASRAFVEHQMGRRSRAKSPGRTKKKVAKA
jgi:DNA repair protein RecO (recombination protein O)